MAGGTWASASCGRSKDRSQSTTICLLASKAAGKEWGWYPQTCSVTGTLALLLGIDVIALIATAMQEFRSDPRGAAGKSADAIKKIGDALRDLCLIKDTPELLRCRPLGLSDEGRRWTGSRREEQSQSSCWARSLHLRPIRSTRK